MSIVYDMQVGILRHIERRAEIITIFLAWFFSSGPMPVANLAAGPQGTVESSLSGPT